MQSLSTPRSYVSAQDVNAQPRYGKNAAYPPKPLPQRVAERQSLRIREGLSCRSPHRDPGYSTFGLDTRMDKMTAPDAP